MLQQLEEEWWWQEGLAVAIASETDLVKVQQLLFIVADGVVGVGIMRSELDGCDVICQCSLLLIVKASQINLHVKHAFSLASKV